MAKDQSREAFGFLDARSIQRLLCSPSSIDFQGSAGDHA